MSVEWSTGTGIGGLPEGFVVDNRKAHFHLIEGIQGVEVQETIFHFAGTQAHCEYSRLGATGSSQSRKRQGSHGLVLYAPGSARQGVKHNQAVAPGIGYVGLATHASIGCAAIRQVHHQGGEDGHAGRVGIRGQWVSLYELVADQVKSKDLWRTQLQGVDLTGVHHPESPALVDL